MVHGYTMIESERLSFVRNNQSKLRVDKYNNIRQPNSTTEQEGSNKGKKVVLPLTFVGSTRFMNQLYFDGMTIYSNVVFSYLFLTLTCNLKWPKIRRVLSNMNSIASDRPNIISRVFRIKFDQLLSYLTKNHLNGRVIACKYISTFYYYELIILYMYTIEFQKHGPPHANLLLFLHPNSKYPTGDDIDREISAEISCPIENPKLHQYVKEHMIHGPCGIAKKSLSCTKTGKCSWFYPKKFQVRTTISEDCFPHYHRRGNSITVIKNDISLYNCFLFHTTPSCYLNIKLI